jgi:sugar/nucleoside kinase (ribokinase family)
MTTPAEEDPPAIPRPHRLIGVASVLIDLTVLLPRLPERGSDVVGREVGWAPGGGINTLGAARRLGLPGVYAAPHGTGRCGDAVRAALGAEGIETLLPTDPLDDTGYCLAMVEPDGERTFVTVPGVEAHQTAAQLDAVRTRTGDAVYASGYDLGYPGSGPQLAPWLAGLDRPPAGPWLVLDPGPLVAEIPADRLDAVLARTDLISLSGAELDLFGGRTALRDRLSADATVLLREGAQGARLLADDPDADLHVPAVRPPGPVIDSNGAGDVHLGAVLAALSAGAGWRGALELAACAAAWSLTRRGAASGPHWHQLLEAYPQAKHPLP